MPETRPLAPERPDCYPPAVEDQIVDDARAAFLAKVRQARAMSPEEKFRAGAELFEESCRWVEAGIAARHPDAGPEDLAIRLRKQLALADRLGR